jgi:hypothetical protein
MTIKRMIRLALDLELIETLKTLDMTVKTKRRIVLLRKAIRAGWRSFWRVMKGAPDTSHPALKKFPKPYPVCNSDEHTFIEKYQLSTKEKLYYVEREIHRLSREVMMNEGPSAGRLTREQTFFLCMYKKEKSALENGPLY